MGRRTRKRTAPRDDDASAPDPAALAREPAPAPRPPSPSLANRTPKARLDDAPKAPWHPFPLDELTILLGIVLIVWGFVGGGDRRILLLGCGFALVSLAAIDQALREHFAGYRSHSALLAGALAVFTCGVLAVAAVVLNDQTGTRLPQELLLLIGAVVFGLAYRGLRSAFRRRTGGIAFRA